MPPTFAAIRRTELLALRLGFYITKTLNKAARRGHQNEITDQECRTVLEAGLAGHTNGLLLSRAEPFLTTDKGLQCQQNFGSRWIAVTAGDEAPLPPVTAL
jgi:hypothetical protein